jgi:hypothetical protein
MIFGNVEIHTFPNEGVQKHLVRDTTFQWESKESGYRAESEKE